MEVDLATAIPPEAIGVNVPAADWKEAILAVGRHLTLAGVTTAAYATEMIDAVIDHGPYIVVAPGVAIAHSRPSPAVLRTGLALISLKTPVEFGSPVNDPVRVLVGLAAVDHDSHLDLMAALARFLGNPQKIAALAEATDVTEVSELLREESS